MSSFSSSSDLSSPPANSNPVQKTRKRSNRQKAEAQFDFKAKPIKLDKFFSDLKIEDQLIYCDYQESDLLKLETKEIEPDPIENLKTAIVEIEVAKQSATSDLIEDYHLDLIFVEPVHIEVSKQIDNYVESSISKIPFQQQVGFLNSMDLFIERRLFSAIQHVQMFDSNLIREKLNVEKTLINLDPNKMYHQDHGSYSALKRSIWLLNKNHSPIREFFDFEKERLDLNSLFERYDKRRFNNDINLRYAIAFYALFQLNGKCFLHLNSTIHSLHDGFKNYFDEYLTLKELFNSIGIYFFNDYLDFSSCIRKIVPLVAHQLFSNFEEMEYLLKLKIRKLKQDFNK